MQAGFINAKVRSLSRCFVSGSNGTCSEMKSDTRSSSSRETGVTPSSLMTRSGIGLGLWNRIRMLNPAARHGLADPPKADDPQRFAVDVVADKQLRVPGGEFPGARKPVGLHHAARGGHEQGPGKICSGFSEDAGSVRDNDAGSGSRCDIDMIDAHAEIRDYLELRRSRKQFGVDDIGDHGQCPVSVFEMRDQLALRKNAIAAVNSNLGVAFQSFDGVTKDGPRDIDPRGHYFSVIWITATFAFASTHSVSVLLELGCFRSQQLPAGAQRYLGRAFE